MKAFVVVVSGLLLSSGAFAQTSGGVMSGSAASLSTGTTEVPEDAAATAEDSQSQNGDRRICRRIETASGSRMSFRRLCMTAAQWRNFYRNN